MRLTLLAAVAVIAAAACTNETEPAADVAEPAAEAPAPEPAAAPATDMAGMDHGPMDAGMAEADTADDEATAETPEGHMFHTYPAKIESVHLPAAGDGAWTAVVSHPDLVAVGAGADETMPDGTVHHVVRVEPKASGNADVTFEKRASADPASEVTETRTVHFMIH